MTTNQVATPMPDVAATGAGTRYETTFTLPL
jgi:hypothetical protein